VEAPSKSGSEIWTKSEIAVAAACVKRQDNERNTRTRLQLGAKGHHCNVQGMLEDGVLPQNMEEGKTYTHCKARERNLRRYHKVSTDKLDYPVSS